jgi:NADH-quinone oxidoreductase subunit G
VVIITVCVGSSCYLRGAHKVAEALEGAILRHGLRGKIELQGAFCLNRCLEGVAVSVNGQPVPRVTEENVEDIFRAYVLGEVNLDASHPRQTRAL